MGYEEEIKDVYDISKSYESKIMYVFLILGNMKEIYLI